MSASGSGSWRGHIRQRGTTDERICPRRHLGLERYGFKYGRGGNISRHHSTSDTSLSITAWRFMLLVFRCFMVAAIFGNHRRGRKYNHVRAV